jgi:hypothetical protein
MNRYSLVLFFLLVLLSDSFTQEKYSTSVRLLFYNVENFFDTSDDTLKNDNEFLPAGSMRWNKTRYKAKINAIYKVISAAGEWDYPGIVGFCEVEKKSVLQDLVFETYLNKYNWGIIHEESGDPRGIDVCLIYRKDLASLLSYRYFKPEGIKEIDFKTRGVLYSKFLFYDDTIHLFINHWPSRRGGALAEESLRKMISVMVKDKTDSISNSVFKRAKIIVAGDFNCTPDDAVMSILTGEAANDLPGNKATLVNLSEISAGKGEGTYRYMGVWEMIDQVLVSDFLTGCTEGLYTAVPLLKVFNSRFLLSRDPVYPGYSPFSTYKGFRYQGGFSDHLPVILDLKRR